MEAKTLVEEIKTSLGTKDLFSSDPALKRKVMKQLAFRLPCRPLMVFCYLYLVRLGFLDGVPGLTYCRLRAMYEYMIDLKVSELRRRDKRCPA